MKIQVELKHVAIIVGILMSFLMLGMIVFVWIRGSAINSNLKELTESCIRETEWTNPSLRCTNPVIKKGGYIDLKNKLNNKIEVWKEEGTVHEVSIFFRDLEEGPSFGINDRMGFIGASLLKVPVMITYFKLAEDNPEILDDLIFIDREVTLFNQELYPQIKIEQGKSYTIDDLIFRMIVYSDNGAYFALIQNLKDISPDVDLIVETYKDLGMVAENDDINAADLSSKTYASMFRILFNNSYLNHKYSEKALSYLGSVEFHSGLNAGVPEGIPVAHKFGERELNGGIKHFHDCGIIYYPGNPYSLCVMTRGKDINQLAEIIGSISREVYQEIDSRRY